MKIRVELDAEWDQFRRWLSEMIGGAVEKEVMRKKLDELLAAERAYVDRAQQAAAIRWVARYLGEGDGIAQRRLADRVEAGEATVLE